tara:strand:+ start:209 stop:841 length:633 start_codon:yes stop_codon:yes gene_type:complete
MIEELLIIEDNPDFSGAALDYFGGLGLNPLVVSDYNDFESLLKSRVFDGAVVDCFFPYKTRSEDISKGLEILDRINLELKPSSTPLSKALKQVGNMLGEDFAKLAALNAGIYYSSSVNNLEVMKQAMKESEYNQPLGILAGEELSDKNVPFVLATSTYHHDVLTQPIQDYASKKGWRLVDCNPEFDSEKSSLEFWDKAYMNLQEIVRRSN